MAVADNNTQSMREICDEDRPHIQRILLLLLDFNDRVGNAAPEPANSLRRAIACADHRHVRFFVEPITDDDGADFVYKVLGEYTQYPDMVTTSWVHEDGIRSERDLYPAGHPVHSITCLTDLYERAIRN